MGNDASVVALNPEAFLDEEFERYGYQIQQVHGVSKPISCPKTNLLALDPFFDVLVGIDENELHEPSEQVNRRLYAYVEYLRNNLKSTTARWLQERRQDHSDSSNHLSEEMASHAPSVTVSLKLLNLRNLTFRALDYVLRCTLHESTDPEAYRRYDIRIPSLGFSVYFQPVSLIIRQFYCIAEIDQRSPFVRASINPSAEVLIGYSLVDGDGYHTNATSLDTSISAISQLVLSWRGQSVGLLLYDITKGSKRLVEGRIGENGLGIALEGNVRAWQRIYETSSINTTLESFASAYDQYEEHQPSLMALIRAPSDAFDIPIPCMLEEHCPSPRRLPDYFPSSMSSDSQESFHRRLDPTGSQAHTISYTAQEPELGSDLSETTSSHDEEHITKQVDSTLSYGEEPTNTPTTELHCQEGEESLLKRDMIISDEPLSSPRFRKISSLPHNPSLSKYPHLMEVGLKVASTFCCDTVDDMLGMIQLLDQVEVKSISARRYNTID